MRESKGFDDLQTGSVRTLTNHLWKNHYLPPSSLAITSALSSVVVHAIELLELPKEIPMATLSPGFAPFVELFVDIMKSEYALQ
jgi:hypothetical protein